MRSRRRRRGQCSVCEFPVHSRDALCPSCAQLVEASEAVKDRLIDLVQEPATRARSATGPVAST